MVVNPPSQYNSSPSPPTTLQGWASRDLSADGSQHQVQLGVYPGVGAAGGGAVTRGRQRGAAVFGVQSAKELSGMDRPRVAIAGTSSQLHPSSAGSILRGVGGGSSGGASAGSHGILLNPGTRSSSSSHSPVRCQYNYYNNTRADGGGCSGSGGLVPAEAESSPVEHQYHVGMEAGHSRVDPASSSFPAAAATATAGAAAAAAGTTTVASTLPIPSAPQEESTQASSRGGSARSRSRSKKSKRPSRSSKRHSEKRSKRRERERGGDEMRPEMPTAAPNTSGADEMRPSPGPDPAPPGPWMT